MTNSNVVSIVSKKTSSQVFDPRNHEQIEAAKLEACTLLSSTDYRYNNLNVNKTTLEALALLVHMTQMPDSRLYADSFLLANGDYQESRRNMSTAMTAALNLIRERDGLHTAQTAATPKAIFSDDDVKSEWIKKLSLD